MTDAQHYRDELRSVVAGRPWIVALDVMVPCGPLAELLMELGASRVLCIAGTRGTGPLPDAERFEQILLGTHGDDIMSSIRAAEHAMNHLPAEAQARVDAFDPDGEAWVVAGIVSNGRPIGERPVFGSRPRAWQDIEDKMTIDALWDAAGVPRAPSAIVPTQAAALSAAAAQLDQGHGTVWVGDNTDGWHGGASLLRWVRNAEEADAAYAFLSERCSEARVMPFVAGVPCSVHGVAFGPDEVIAFRPCEMLILQTPGSARLTYAQAATFWDPAPAVREAMRDAAVRAGTHIARTAGYRGVFTVDGVVGADGFVPTELNPRFGGAILRMAGSLPDLPLYLLHLAIAEGLTLDYRPRALEALVLEHADAHRRGAALQLLPKRVTEEQSVRLRLGDDGVAAVVGEADAADATAMWGQGPTGSVVRMMLDPERTPVGPPTAPRVCALLDALDAHWGLGLPALAPMPSVS